MKGRSLDDNLTEIRGKLLLIMVLRFEFNIATLSLVLSRLQTLLQSNALNLVSMEILQ